MRFLERGEAIRREPRAPYAWDEVAEVRSFGAMEQTILERGLLKPVEAAGGFAKVKP
ncbi:MAG: hypothetical protein HY298_22765 [Verrucomicrobia bacterium]|nr:hypothetical protein [Verrucomicrobiota bacterium]